MIYEPSSDFNVFVISNYSVQIVGRENSYIYIYIIISCGFGSTIYISRIQKKKKEKEKK